MNEAAAQGMPPWSTIAVILGLVVLGGSLVAVFTAHDRRIERRRYWAGCLGGGALLAVAALPHGPRAAALVMAAFILGPAIIAIRFSPYLKIGGRIIAARERDRRPDPPTSTGPGA